MIDFQKSYRLLRQYFAVIVYHISTSVQNFNKKSCNVTRENKYRASRTSGVHITCTCLKKKYDTRQMWKILIRRKHPRDQIESLFLQYAWRKSRGDSLARRRVTRSLQISRKSIVKLSHRSRCYRPTLDARPDCCRDQWLSHRGVQRASYTFTSPWDTAASQNAGQKLFSFCHFSLFS